MKRDRILASLICTCLCVSMLGVAGCSKKEVKIYGKDNEVFATINSASLEKVKLEDENYRAYLELILDEALQVISEAKECSKEKAEKILFDEKYAIYTSFDKKVYNSLKDTYKNYEKNVMSFGSAVTDTKGNLLAVYSGGNTEGDYINYATTRTAPYSSLKPLSVYAPALEKGTISWSKTYEDSPIKQIEQENGSKRDWPANASNSYSNEQVFVYDAVKQSLNTVAVKCLQEYGVENSIRFLKENFNISLAFEESRIHTLGEDEIIGNIALGYLYDGVSPVEMAGYYQSFATGGIYTEPKTVTKICDAQGETLYERKQEGNMVMNYETAFVMNQLLQGVVTRGGTGEAAHCEGVQIGGKTGTGSEGNWFVGFTPEYTCAVWHGKELMKNQAAEMFSKAVSQFTHNEKASFPECKTVKISAYCLESGKLFSGNCRKVDKGYYTSLDTTERCDQH